MIYKSNFERKRFITLIAFKWFVPSMYSSVSHHVAIAGEGECPLEPGRHLGEEEDQGVGATAVTGAGTQQTIVLREVTLNFSSQTYPWIY